MKKPELSLLLFDVGNVIIKADHALTHRYLIEKGIAEEKAINFYTITEYKEFARGAIHDLQYFEALCTHCLGQSFSYDMAVTAHDIHMYDVDLEVIQILKDVSAISLVAFATDTNVWQTRREKELVNLKEFGDIFFRSNEVRQIKSDDGFFTLLLSQLPYSPESIFFIDDSPEKIEQAKKVGMQTHLFTSAESLTKALQDHTIL